MKRDTGLLECQIKGMSICRNRSRKGPERTGKCVFFLSVSELKNCKKLIKKVLTIKKCIKDTNKLVSFKYFLKLYSSTHNKGKEKTAQVVFLKMEYTKNKKEKMSQKFCCGKCRGTDTVTHCQCANSHARKAIGKAEKMVYDTQPYSRKNENRPL